MSRCYIDEACFGRREGEAGDEPASGAFSRGLSLYVAGLCSIGYGLRQIIDAQAAAGAPVEKVVISGGAGQLDLVRQLLADATGRPLLATRSEEPVLLGAAILGSVAGGTFPDMRSAMAALSATDRAYRPAGGETAAIHDARYAAFTQIQELARKIRESPSGSF